MRAIKIVGWGTALTVATGMLSVPALASTAEDGPVLVRRDAGQPEPPPALAAGVIVRTRAGASPAAVRAAAAQALDAPVQAGVAVSRHTRAYPTAELIPYAEAQQAATELAADPGVVWAEPNGIRHPQAQSVWPTPVNDSYASQLRNLWDIRGPEDAYVSGIGVTPWPAGGYGTKAPALWPATTGAGIVVAVLDTGILPNHPDLASQLVPGFDFISAGPGAGFVSANDGDGRDANPSDPGDWVTSGLCVQGQQARASTWHGSYVAGTIGAAANNAQGVVGVSPGVKIQPVRVLGRCGGSDADISAAIQWAAGLPVPGIPANPTPAKVINMSLGGQGTCSQSYKDSIAAARSVGATVVVALGNDGLNLDQTPVTPAGCAGVVGVHSVSDYGDHASYSNFGTAADVSAPGGDQGWEGLEILSTVDTGTTTPVAPGYAAKQGTSMAAPAVAGAAALLASIGGFSPDGLEAALKAAVIGFPIAGNPNAGFVACNTNQCGTGIIDLTQVPAATAPPAVTGFAAPGGVLTATNGGWLGPPAALVTTWYANGVPVGTGASYAVTAANAGRSLVARVSVASGPFATIGANSAPVGIAAPPPPPAPAKRAAKVTIKAASKVRRGARPKVTITIKVDGAKRPTGKVAVLDGGKKLIRVKLKAKHKGKVTIRLPHLSAGRHKITVIYSGTGAIAGARGTKTIRAGR